MKKLYFLFALAFVGLTASAVNLEKVKDVLSSKVKTHKAISPEKLQSLIELKEKHGNTIATRAMVNPSLEGNWTFYFGDYLSQVSTNSNIEIDMFSEFYTEEYEGETFEAWYFDSVNGEILPVLFYEEEDYPGTIIFPFDIVGYTDQYIITQEPCIWDLVNEEDYDWPEYVTLTYNEATGIIVPDLDLPSDDYALAFYWGAYDPETYEEVGYFNWLIFYNAVKTSQGGEGEGDDSNGVESIMGNNNAPAVYYNLQGQKIDNPTNGIFIKKQGKKASKVMVK